MRVEANDVVGTDQGDLARDPIGAQGCLCRVAEGKPVQGQEVSLEADLRAKDDAKPMLTRSACRQRPLLPSNPAGALKNGRLSKECEGRNRAATAAGALPVIVTAVPGGNPAGGFGLVTMAAAMF